VDELSFAYLIPIAYFHKFVSKSIDMFKKITLFFISTVIGFNLQAQNVPEVQQTLITKVTATWCTNCGTWGWSFYEGLSEDNDDKALMLKAHYSGDLQTTIGTEMGNNFNISGQPRFIVNNTDKNANSGNTNNLRTAIETEVDENFAQSPTVNAGLNVSMANGELTIDVKTKFFEASSGEYYTNVYLVEDNVIANQSGQSTGASTSHQDVVRATAHSSTFGQLVVNGSAEAGMEVNHSYTVDVNSNWDVNNLEFMAVVWSKSGNTYIFENGSSQTLESSTPVTDISEDINLSIQPTLVVDNTNINISLEKSDDLSISLYNLNGQEIRNIHTGNLSAGNHHFTVEKGNISSGIYLVHIQNNKGLVTRKIVFQ